MSPLTKTFGTFVVSGLAVVLLASGCSLRAKSAGPSLHFDLRSLSQRQAVNGIVDMADFSDFSCFAINVTGPGIEDSDPYRTDKDPAQDFARTLAGSPCAYRGVVSPPIYLSTSGMMQGELAMKLPPGPVRMVQLVGVKDLASCQRGFIDPIDANQNLENYYELGRAEVRDFFQDRSVALPIAAWSSLTSTEQEELNMDSCFDGTNGADTTPPVVTITNPVASLVTNASLTVSGITPNEAIAHYCILLNAATNTGCSWVAATLPPSLGVVLSDGDEGGVNKVSIWAKDAAGNVSARADTNTFYYDSPTLVPTLSNAQISVATGAAGKVNVVVADNGSSYHDTVCLIDSLTTGAVSSGGCVWIPKAASYEHTASNSGNVYIHVFVKDSHGQISPGAVSTQIAVGV